MPEIRMYKAVSYAERYINNRNYKRPFAEYIRYGMHSSVIHTKLMVLEWKTSPPISVNTPEIRAMYQGDEETVKLANAIVNQKLKEYEHSIKSR